MALKGQKKREDVVMSENDLMDMKAITECFNQEDDERTNEILKTWNAPFLSKNSEFSRLIINPSAIGDISASSNMGITGTSSERSEDISDDDGKEVAKKNSKYKRLKKKRRRVDEYRLIQEEEEEDGDDDRLIMFDLVDPEEIDGVFANNIGDVMRSSIAGSTDGSLNPHNIWVFTIPFDFFPSELRNRMKIDGRSPRYGDLNFRGAVEHALKEQLFFLTEIWSEHFVRKCRIKKSNSERKRANENYDDREDPQLYMSDSVVQQHNDPHSFIYDGGRFIKIFHRVKVFEEYILDDERQVVGVRIWFFKIDHDLRLDEQIIKLVQKHDELRADKINRGTVTNKNMNARYDNPSCHKIVNGINDYAAYMKSIRTLFEHDDAVISNAHKLWPDPFSDDDNTLKPGFFYSLAPYAPGLVALFDGEESDVDSQEGSSCGGPLFAGGARINTFAHAKQTKTKVQDWETRFSECFVGHSLTKISPILASRHKQLKLSNYVEMRGGYIQNFKFPCPELVYEVSSTDIDPIRFESRLVIRPSFKAPEVSRYIEKVGHSVMVNIPVEEKNKRTGESDNESEDEFDKIKPRRHKESTERKSFTRTTDQILEDTNADTIEEFAHLQAREVSHILSLNLVKNADGSIQSDVMTKDGDSSDRMFSDLKEEFGTDPDLKDNIYSEDTLTPSYGGIGYMPPLYGLDDLKLSDEEEMTMDLSTRMSCMGFSNDSISEKLREYDVIEDEKHANMNKWQQLFEEHAKKESAVSNTILTMTNWLRCENTSFLYEHLSQSDFEKYELCLKNSKEMMDAIEKNKMQDVRERRVRMANKIWNILNSADTEYRERLSGPLKSILNNFSALTSRNQDLYSFWFNLQMKFSNLGVFGNFMAQLINLFKTSFRIKASGGNFRHLVNILTASLSTWDFEIVPDSKVPTEDEQMYHYLMAGPPESSKSFLINVMNCCLVNGTVQERTHESALASTADKGDRDMVAMFHEASEILYGGTGRAGDRGKESQVFKDRVKGFTVTRRLVKNPRSIEEGQPSYIAPLTVTMSGEVCISASNDPVGSGHENAGQTRVQIEYKTDDDSRVGGRGKVDIHALMTELNSEDFRQLTGPMRRMIHSLQTVYAFKATHTRSRVIPVIDTTAYDIIINLIIKEVQTTFGIKCVKNSRTITRGRIMARTLGGLNAIYCEYFSPLGVHRHQTSRTGKLDKPFNFVGMIDSFAKRLFVTAEVAIFAITCQQYQLISVVKSEVRCNLKDYLTRTRYHRDRIPFQVNTEIAGYSKKKLPKYKAYLKKMKEIGRQREEARQAGTQFIPENPIPTAPNYNLTTGEDYNPVKDPDFLGFLDCTDRPLFRVVRQEVDRIANVVRITYDPNYFLIVFTAADETPLEWLAKEIHTNTGGELEPSVYLAKLKEIESEPLYNCKYIYPTRVESFKGSSLDNMTPGSIEYNRNRMLSPDWIARVVGDGPGHISSHESQKKPLYMESTNLHHKQHIYVLRQMIEELFGGYSVRHVMKQAIENVINKLPGIDHDILLSQVHMGMDQDNQCVSFPSLMEVARLRKGKRKNLDRKRDKNGEIETDRPEDCIRLRNEMPLSELDEMILKSGISPTFDAVVSRHLSNTRVKASEYTISPNGMPIDEYCARRHAQRLCVEFDPSVLPSETRKNILRVQREWDRQIHRKTVLHHYPDYFRNRINDDMIRIQENNSTAGLIHSMPYSKDVKSTSEYQEFVSGLVSHLKGVLGVESFHQITTEDPDDHLNEEQLKMAKLVAKRQERIMSRILAFCQGNTAEEVDTMFPKNVEEDYNDDVDDDDEYNGTNAIDYLVAPDYSIVFTEKEAPSMGYKFSSVYDLVETIKTREFAASIPKELAEMDLATLEQSLRDNLVQSIKNIIPVCLKASAAKDKNNAMYLTTKVLKMVLNKMELDADLYQCVLGDAEQMLQEKEDELIAAKKQEDINAKEHYKAFIREKRRIMRRQQRPKINVDRYDPVTKKLRRPSGVGIRPTHDICLLDTNGIMVEMNPGRVRDPIVYGIAMDDKRMNYALNRTEDTITKSIFSPDTDKYDTSYIIELKSDSQCIDFAKKVIEELTYSREDDVMPYLRILRHTDCLAAIRDDLNKRDEEKRKKMPLSKYMPNKQTPVRVKVVVNRDTVNVRRIAMVEDMISVAARGCIERLQRTVDTVTRYACIPTKETYNHGSLSLYHDNLRKGYAKNTSIHSREERIPASERYIMKFEEDHLFQNRPSNQGLDMAEWGSAREWPYMAILD